MILVARRKNVLSDLAKSLQRDFKVDIKIFAVDVQKLDEIDQCFKELKDVSIDALVNNAGLARSKVHFDDYAWSDIEEMLATNIQGFLRMAHLALPSLKNTKGHIINISSIAGREGYENGAVYCGTKAFVRMFSKAIRFDLLGTGVRVTDIAPGMVDTDFSRVRFHGDADKAKAVYQGFVPLRATDIAECIAFCLERPPHVNIDEMLIMPTAQVGVHAVHKK